MNEAPEQQQLILRCIEAYKREQETILRVIRRRGELTDYDFDRIFSDTKVITKLNGLTVSIRRYPKLRFYGQRSGDTIILGGMYPHDSAKWLHLLNLMVAAGLVACKRSRKTRKIVYSLPGEE